MADRKPPSRHKPVRLAIEPGHLERGPNQDLCHRFDAASIDAINAALAARRPLLVRGEPGTGKSQLAAAAARVLRRPLVTHVVDARTEARDLLWRFDAVERLGKAQVLAGTRKDEREVECLLAEANFVRPGPLWWAFAWDYCRDTLRQAEPSTPPADWRSEHGVVVLIDEIDKADSDVPNGLLEALGNHRFEPLAHGVVQASGPEPLVILTTNEERALPDAFVRRCLVLKMPFPDDAELGARARAHFGGIAEPVVDEALRMLAADRKMATDHQLPKPGQAEFLDLLRAVRELEPEPKAQLELMQRLKQFVFDKHGSA